MMIESTTIIRPATSLATLPPASEAAFEGRAPWAVVTTGTLVKSLRIDRGNWATWRCRGIGPAELPSGWFRPTAGRPARYRVETALAWIAGRRGEPFDPLTNWRSWFHTEFGADIADPAELRRQAHLLARAAGLKPEPDVTFTPSGFDKYLDSVLLQ